MTNWCLTKVSRIFSGEWISFWTNVSGIIRQSHPEKLQNSYNCPLLFPSSILDTFQPGGSSSSSVISFCLFILFMGFLQEEYWSGLPFPPPVDHVSSELSTMTCSSWVSLYSHSLFMETLYLKLEKQLFLAIPLSLKYISHFSQTLFMSFSDRLKLLKVMLPMTTHERKSSESKKKKNLHLKSI